MKSINYIGRIILSLGIILLMMRLSSYAQLPQKTQLSIGKHKVEEGNTLSIALNIKSANQITALKLILSFDISVIELSDITPIETIKTEAIFQVVDQGRGKVAVLLVAANGLPINGTLLHLNFKALGSEGQGSLLAIEEAKALKDSSGEKVSIEVSDGYIAIINPSVSNLLYPLGFGLALFGAIVLAVTGIKLLYSRKKVKSLCPSCTYLLRKESSYCPNCKQVFRKKCSNCGAIVPINNIKCPYCHQSLSDISYAYKPLRSAILEVLSGWAKGKRYVLESSIAGIGRSRKNQIVLRDDQEVSGYHAQIVRQGDYFTILDLKSTNGTFVNQKRINQQVLRDGDEIYIGSTKFTFHQ